MTAKNIGEEIFFKFFKANKNNKYLGETNQLKTKIYR